MGDWGFGVKGWALEDFGVLPAPMVGGSMGNWGFGVKGWALEDFGVFLIPMVGGFYGGLKGGSMVGPWRTLGSFETPMVGGIYGGMGVWGQELGLGGLWGPSSPIDWGVLWGNGGGGVNGWALKAQHSTTTPQRRPNAGRQHRCPQPLLGPHLPPLLPTHPWVTHPWGHRSAPKPNF